MIACMAKKVKSKLAATITRGRKAAGSLTKLLDALGDPRLSDRTVEKWEMEETVPAVDRGLAFMARVEGYLKRAKGGKVEK